jgi:hypothetical protein
VISFLLHKIFLVLDEAQRAATRLTDCFPSVSDTHKTRSVLYAAYRCLTDWNIPDGIIVSGTGLSLDILHDTSKSFAAKLTKAIYAGSVYADTGDFQDAASHESYIQRYLDLSDSVSDQCLLQCMLHWFKGRWVCCYRYLIPRLGTTS